jgi:hypothetical protein
MADNLGVQAANMVDDKIREYRTLQEEINTHRSDMGTLMAQRNENELVKQVRRGGGMIRIKIWMIRTTYVIVIILPFITYNHQ